MIINILIHIDNDRTLLNTDNKVLIQIWISNVSHCYLGVDILITTNSIYN